MPIIDTYTLFGSWPAGGADLSLEQLKRAVAGRGIEKAIAHSTDAIFEADTRILGMTAKALSEVPGFAPAAVLDPSRYLKPWELAAQIAGQPFACVRFFPEVHNWPVGSYAPFEMCLEALAPSGVPVSVAITSTGQITGLSKIPAAARVPLILVHVKHDCLSEVAAVMPKMENWLLSTDGITHVGLLPGLVEVVGAERILFGSTAPRGSIEGSLKYVQTSSLPDNVIEAILYSNAKRVFGGRLGSD